MSKILIIITFVALFIIIINQIDLGEYNSDNLRKGYYVYNEQNSTFTKKFYYSF